MTYEEAIESINNVLSSDYHYDETLGYQLTSDDIEWIELAISALEKQIPKKPDLDGGIYCPCCLHEFKENYDTASYCPNCGQAIDWSDTE